jgi:hypothetical protein
VEVSIRSERCSSGGSTGARRRTVLFQFHITVTLATSLCRANRSFIGLSSRHT